VLSKAAEDAERKRQEPFITEEELLEALDFLTEIAKEQKR